MTEQTKIQIKRHFDRESYLTVTVVPFDAADEYEVTFSNPDQALQDIQMLENEADVYL